MKTQITYIGLSITSLIISLTSCEKVIDINIKDADKKLVIEGSVANLPEYNYVKLSFTKGFSSTADYENASGAVVFITDEDGNEYTLTETEPGMYTNPSLIGQAYQNYSLRVEWEGNSYTASAFLPGNTPIDTLFSANLDGAFTGGGYAAFCYFTDKANETNYYRIRTYENGIRQSALYIENDQLRNGIFTGVPLFGNSFSLNDTAVIQLMEVDEKVYTYFKSLADITNPQNQPAAPGNPLTNISGGALGVFAAYNIESDTLVITD
jgi:hypothetical protein